MRRRLDVEPIRTGIALLEILIAVTLLAVAGSGWIMLSLQTSQALADSVEREQEVRDASMLLARFTRLPGDDIGRAAGRRRVGTLELRISILRPGLFDVSIHQPRTGRAILGATIYRIPRVATHAP